MTRREIVSGMIAAGTLPGTTKAEANAATMPHEPVSERSGRDLRFMGLAIEEARQADYPFGAVITRGDTVLARGRNSGTTRRDPTAHGEMVAIHEFLAAHGPELLRGTTLYTSGEPCPMCMGAILWCGIGRVVFAASIAQLALRMNQIMISSADMAQHAFAPIEITGGLLADEALALFDAGGTARLSSPARPGRP